MTLQFLKVNPGTPPKPGRTSNPKQGGPIWVPGRHRYTGIYVIPFAISLRLRKSRPPAFLALQKSIRSFPRQLDLLWVKGSDGITRWWQLKYFSFSSRSLGKWSNLTHIFQLGWFNHQPDKCVYLSKESLNDKTTWELSHPNLQVVSLHRTDDWIYDNMKIRMHPALFFWKVGLHCHVFVDLWKGSWGYTERRFDILHCWF